MSRSWTPTLQSRRGNSSRPAPRLASARAQAAKTKASVGAPERGLLPRSEGPAAPRPTRRIARWILVGIGSLVTIVTGFFVGAHISRGRAQAATPPAVVMPSEGSLVFVRATPADATLFFDDVQLPDNPARVHHVRDGVAHTVHAVAPGHQRKDVNVALDGPTVSIDIALDVDPVTVASPSPRPSSSPPAIRPYHPHGTVAAAPSPNAEPSGKKKPTLDTTDPWQR